MKYLVILAAAILIVLSQGCTSNDRDQPGPQTSILKPAPAVVPSASAGAAPISWPSDPAANGGFTLPAAAPYKQDGSAPVQQNINPTPFLTTSRNEAGTASGTLGNTLASRADGTMSGPHDHPAATRGW